MSVRIRIRNDPEARVRFREFTSRWVQVYLDQADEQLPAEEVAPAVRVAAAAHIKEIMPGIEGLLDDYEREYLASLIQREAETTIASWERKNLGNRWGQLRT